MPRGRRFLEIMTAAGLADKELERERIAADRDAQQAQVWSGTLQGLAQLVPDTAMKAYDRAEAGAVEQGKAIASKYRGQTGDDLLDPRGAAGIAVADEPGLVEEEGNPLLDMFVKPLRDRKRAIAEAGIAENFAAGREKATTNKRLDDTLDLQREEAKARRAKEEADADRAAAKAVEDTKRWEEGIRQKDLDRQAAQKRADTMAGASWNRYVTGLDDKKKTQVLEVEGFVRNINDQLDALERQIKESGTFEALGPESFDMERRITSVATDLAKLADPGSVAREGEVALAKKGLFPTGLKGMFVNNDTALATIRHLREEVNKRRGNAYAIRGLELPSTGGDVDYGAQDFGVE